MFWEIVDHRGCGFRQNRAIGGDPEVDHPLNNVGRRHTSYVYKVMSMRRSTSKLGNRGLVRELNPGPLAPEARIIPLDQRADCYVPIWPQCICNRIVTYYK